MRVRFEREVTAVRDNRSTSSLSRLRRGGATHPIHAGLRRGIYTKASDPEYEEDGASSPMRSFRYGERLRFPVKLRTPRNFPNPGAFDYQGYLADNGIVVLGSAHVAKVEVLPGFWEHAWPNGVNEFIPVSCARFTCCG